MDVTAESMREDFSQYPSLGYRMGESATLDRYDHLPLCALCNRTFSLEIGVRGPQTVRFCGDCNFLISENATDRYRRTQLSRTRRRNRSSGTNFFLSQGSHFEDDTQSTDSGSATQTTPSQSRRHRVVSTDSESVDSESDMSFNGSRIFAGESDTASYSAYGGESDASADWYTFSDSLTDTDIDPMNVGLYHWNSEEDTERSDSDADENRVANLDIVGELRDFESSFRRITGQPLRLDSLGSSLTNLEALQAAAEIEISRMWSLPTARSFINNLPQLVIQEDHENLDELACAICKDSLSVGTIVKQLPCLHIYHPHCILPWLRMQNTCPICRFELPAEDSDELDINDNRRRLGNVDLFPPNFEMVHGRRRRRRRRWPFLAAVLPVIGIVGIVLGFCLGRFNPLAATVQHASLPSVERSSARRRWFPFPF